ncbi:MAG: carbohydrate kinase [Bacteroidales bacterium]|nr:carbohydrate kinase [Bacteroidales bacterium]
MNKRNIYAIGETVLDIIFKNDQPIAAKPGGSMLNTCVSLGRTHAPIHFISEFGTDKPGQIISRFLKENYVDTKFASLYNKGKTAIAMAFLNEKNDASYQFYKDYPGNRLNIEIPPFRKDDILIFGSFYAMTPEIRGVLLNILNFAKKNDVFILYDPNFRKSHLHELEDLKPAIEENFRYAHIIRGSNEDFQYIYNTDDFHSALKSINMPDKTYIYTNSNSEVSILTNKLTKNYIVPAIKPLSTIGAGDTFNAGIIYGLLKHNITVENLSATKAETWENIINLAIAFAQNTCLNLDNYISETFAKQYIIS